MELCRKLTSGLIMVLNFWALTSFFIFIAWDVGDWALYIYSGTLKLDKLIFLIFEVWDYYYGFFSKTKIGTKSSVWSEHENLLSSSSIFKYSEVTSFFESVDWNNIGKSVLISFKFSLWNIFSFLDFRSEYCEFCFILTGILF